MNRPLTALCALLLTGAPPALAASNEISAELGRLDNYDENYEIYNEYAGMPSQGLRIGWGATDRVALIAGWHRIHRGAIVEIEGTNDGIAAAFQANTWSVGVKADVKVTDFVYPYIAIQALGLQARTRLDDEPDTRDNVGQVQRSAFAPGGMATAGAELHLIRNKRTDFAVAWHLELGYGYVSTLDFEDLGDMKPGGFALRSGIGIRF